MAASTLQCGGAGGVMAVVFDLGGVVLGSPLEGIAEYEAEFQVPKGYINVAIVARGRKGAFQRLERGELDMERFYDEFKEELGDPSNVDAYKAWLTKRGKPVPKDLKDRYEIDTVVLFREMMSKAAQINPDMLHGLFVLRGLGFTVAALTNNWKMDEPGEENITDSSSTNRLRAYFDTIIESSVIGLRKPDPRIYDYTCETLGVAPHQVAFLDDIGINLSAARAANWAATIKVEIGQGKRALVELANKLGIRPTLLVPPGNRTTPLAYSIQQGRNPVSVSLFGLAHKPAILLLHRMGENRQYWLHTVQAIVQAGFCALVANLELERLPIQQRSEQLTTVTRLVDSLISRMKLPSLTQGFCIVGVGAEGCAALSTTWKNYARGIVLVDSAQGCVDGADDVLLKEQAFRVEVPCLLVSQRRENPKLQQLAANLPSARLSRVANANEFANESVKFFTKVFEARPNL